MRKPEIPLARFVNAKGQEETVQYMVVGVPLRAGNTQYNPMRHHGGLKCLCCEAPVEFMGGEISRGGSSKKGQRPYARVLSGHSHDDACELRPAGKVKSTPASQSKTEASRADRTKGYLLRLNISPEFNDKSGLADITVGEDIRADLKARQVVIARSAADIVQFIEKANPERLAKTMVAFRNIVVAWEDFVLPLRNPQDFQRIVDRAKAAISDENAPFCLMEMNVPKGKSLSKFDAWNKRVVRSMPLVMGYKDGKQLRIEPSADVASINDRHVLDAFADGGRYLVLGSVRVKPFVGDKVHTQYLNVTVNHPDQVISENIENILEKARPHGRNYGSVPAAPQVSTP